MNSRITGKCRSLSFLAFRRWTSLVGCCRKAQFQGARAAAREEQFSQLLDDFNNDRLPFLEPTSEMQKGLELLQHFTQQIEELQIKIEETAEGPDRDKIIQEGEGMAKARRSVFEAVVVADISRRVKDTDYDPELVALPPPARNFKQKLARLFVSRGLFRQLNFGQRALLIVHLLC